MCISLSACSTSKYEKHIKNIEEYISEIKANDSELATEEDLLGIDILQKTSAKRMKDISREYEKIESDEDKEKFLTYVRSEIPRNIFNKFSSQLEEEDLHEDIVYVFSPF
jgi:hypothetical protein